MAKTRVHELAKTYGIESKEVLEKLKEMGEFVKSPSSTIELPVEMKFKKQYGDALLAAKATEAPAAKPAEKPAVKSAAKAASAPSHRRPPLRSRLHRSSRPLPPRRPLPRRRPKPGPRTTTPEAPAAAAAPAAGATPTADTGTDASDTAGLVRAREGPQPRAPARRPPRRSASGQQPVRRQPGHGPPSGAHAPSARPPTATSVRRARRPAVARAVPACLVPTRR